jgi:hypothetical protein
VQLISILFKINEDYMYIISKIISGCNCDYSLCIISDHKKHVHVDDECFHPNNFHHKIGIKFVKNGKTKNDIDLKTRYLIWGV